MRRSPLLASIALALPFGLVACSGIENPSEASGQQSATTEISQEQRDALDDGEVSREEYELGFRRYQSCMEDIGYPLYSVEESNMVITYSYSAVASENGAKECYLREFQQIDVGWQTRPEVLDKSPTAQLIRSCLTEHGAEPSTNPLELNQQMADIGLKFSDCVS